MKKLIILCLTLIFTMSTVSFAASPAATVTKLSENTLKIELKAEKQIKVTGYTISKGNNIIVYYNNASGTATDSISVDIRTVLRPYRIILSNSEESPLYQPFEDIKNSDMKDYIRHLYDLGYIKGYEEDNTFRPDNNISRAEFITLLVRGLNLKEKSDNKVKFDDFNQNHWAYQDINIAAQNGVVEGYIEEGKTYFRADKSVSIAEAATAIDKAFSINNKSNLNYDVRFINHWAKGNIQSLLNASVISESDSYYKDGKLDRPATRGEIAMLISRALGR